MRRAITHRLLSRWMFAATIVVANICFCRGQDIVTIKSAQGIAPIYGNVTLDHAKQRAIAEAKINALKRAGIAENIKSSELLLNSQVNNSFSQFFISEMQTEIQGAVTNYNILSEGPGLNLHTNLMEYSVTMDADVIKYKTQPDYTFNAEVDSIFSLYKNGTNLQFSIKATQDCFLTIFNITDYDACMLFPNIVEKNQKILKEFNYRFPLKNELQFYSMVANKNQETNQLIFVFTKTKIPFLAVNGEEQLTNKEKIITWIYTIPPDQRYVVYKQFNIIK